jgi:predicted enzyme related to lactoylglutathione lyase
MSKHEKIDYVEFPAKNMEATRAFFSKVFGWSFTDYGPEYMDCPDGGIMTGFFKADRASTTANGSALVTFYSSQLEETRARVEAAGGRIVKPVFSFPGGRRFQFTEPSGNEFAVWSDT